MFELFQIPVNDVASCECASARRSVSHNAALPSTGKPSGRSSRSRGHAFHQFHHDVELAADSPISYIAQMFGWLRPEEERASCSRCSRLEVPGESS